MTPNRSGDSSTSVRQGGSTTVGQAPLRFICSGAVVALLDPPADQQVPQTFGQRGGENRSGTGDNQGAADGCFRYPANGLSILVR